MSCPRWTGFSGKRFQRVGRGRSGFLNLWQVAECKPLGPVTLSPTCAAGAVLIACAGTTRCWPAKSGVGGVLQPAILGAWDGGLARPVTAARVGGGGASGGDIFASMKCRRGAWDMGRLPPAGIFGAKMKARASGARRGGRAVRRSCLTAGKCPQSSFSSEMDFPDGPAWTGARCGSGPAPRARSPRCRGAGPPSAGLRPGRGCRRSGSGRGSPNGN